jgi:hypothetical protein
VANYYWLAANRVANVFDRFANFPSGFAEAFFNFAPCMICLTLGGEIVIAGSPANAFFYVTFNLIPFSFNFISIR